MMSIPVLSVIYDSAISIPCKSLIFVYVFGKVFKVLAKAS
jgi:hypothetical protein